MSSEEFTLQLNAEPLVEEPEALGQTSGGRYRGLLIIYQSLTFFHLWFDRECWDVFNPYIQRLLSTCYLAGIVLDSRNAGVNEICSQPSESSLVLGLAGTKEIIIEQSLWR